MRVIGGSDVSKWQRGAALGCTLLLLVPLVCAGGVATAAPGHDADPSATGHEASPTATAPSHHGAAMGRPHHPHETVASHRAGAHHGHECCVVVARKPGREDKPRVSAPAASSPVVTPAAITVAASVRAGQGPDATSGPPGSAASAIPLRL